MKREQIEALEREEAQSTFDVLEAIDIDQEGEDAIDETVAARPDAVVHHPADIEAAIGKAGVRGAQSAAAAAWGRRGSSSGPAVISGSTFGHQGGATPRPAAT